jgi:hypothetical protein
MGKLLLVRIFRVTDTRAREQFHLAPVGRVAFAIGRNRIAGGLDLGRGIIAMALLPHEMLRDLVLARLLAAGERMALPAARFLAFLFDHRVLLARQAKGRREKFPDGLSHGQRPEADCPEAFERPRLSAPERT